MKKSLIFVGFSLAVVMALIGIGVATASAQTTLTDEQRTRVKSNCMVIKNTLNQLKASDALLRVNRGPVYDSIATKLMDSFNSRLTSNRFDAQGLLSISSGYDEALETFRTDYQVYERALAAAIRIDCTKDPDSFHAAIETARGKRKIVHEDILRLHQYIDDYRSEVESFKGNFERVSGKN